MVTITGYRTRYSAGGDKKIYFQVEGGVKTTVSQASGKAYLSALKASVSFRSSVFLHLPPLALDFLLLAAPPLLPNLNFNAAATAVALAACVPLLLRPPSIRAQHRP